MDISPETVSTAAFRTVKKGFDPDEVRSFLHEVAAALEATNERATAMEARARAALAKLQEMKDSVGSEPDRVAEHEAETISRTLLLAQRTADTTIAEAEAHAAEIRASADDEVAKAVEAAREQATRLVDEARVEARRANEAERVRAESEVQALLARREFLLSDVHHLEEFVAEQRQRVLSVAEQLHDLAERGESGLGEVRPPLLSAAAEGLRRDEPEPVATSEAEAEPDPDVESEPVTVDTVEVHEPYETPESTPVDEVSVPPAAVPAKVDPTPVASSTLPGIDTGSDELRFRSDT